MPSSAKERRLQARVKELKATLKVKEVEYRNHLNKFSRTIEVKSNHKRDVLAARIGDTLSKPYRDLAKIEKMTITPKVGKVIVSLLKQIFQRLESEGIAFH
jgi:hypothetical protein